MELIPYIETDSMTDFNSILFSFPPSVLLVMLSFLQVSSGSASLLKWLGATPHAPPLPPSRGLTTTLL